MAALGWHCPYPFWLSNNIAPDTAVHLRERERGPIWWYHPWDLHYLVPFWRPSVGRILKLSQCFFKFIFSDLVVLFCFVGGGCCVSACACVCVTLKVAVASEIQTKWSCGFSVRSLRVKRLRGCCILMVMILMLLRNYLLQNKFRARDRARRIKT